ncbi:MAG: GTPase Era [Bacilli bacterium]
MNDIKFKSGFVALIGRPNVGKSTLINAFLGKKISIVSDKPQTTRNKILGIHTSPSEQVLFIDTPGIHKPKHELGEMMNHLSLDTLNDVDLILYNIDGNEAFGSGDLFVIDQLRKVKTEVILVVNKIDLVKNKNPLLININKFAQAFAFSEVYYVSALTSENVPKLFKAIVEHLDEGPQYYPEDQMTDYPEPFIIGEMIREKVLMLTREEIPHSVAVVIEEMKENAENPELLDIRALIYVEKASQKKIIIGRNGEMIKEIGTLARKDIVMLLGQKVYLELWVKVEEDWRNKRSQLKKMGYFIQSE